MRVGHCEPFDLYCAPSAAPFREGAVITLDGIDGFFDQYFDAVRPGEIIRFAVLAGGVKAVPDSLQGLEAMPFVRACVKRCDATEGEVEVRSLSTLGEWSRSLQLRPQPLAALQRECQVPLFPLVDRAARDGTAYWSSGATRWRSLGDTTAIGAFQEASGVRVVVIRTYAVPGLVAQVDAAV